MPKYIVVKEHDGVKEGTVKSLPDSPIVRYMVEQGYWKKADEKGTKAKGK